MGYWPFQLVAVYSHSPQMGMKLQEASREPPGSLSSKHGPMVNHGDDIPLGTILGAQPIWPENGKLLGLTGLAKYGWRKAKRTVGANVVWRG